MNKNKSIRIFMILAAAIISSIISIAGSFGTQIVNRPNEGLFGDTYFYVYVISNIPQSDVMPLICREALLKKHGDKSHCNYIPLATLGLHGKKKRDLLPYDAAKRTETILVIDRSRLNNEDARKMELLLESLYPLAPKTDTTKSTINLWVQNSGVYGKENQVIIDIPDIFWLKEAANDLWNMPDGYMRDRSKDTFSIAMPINKLGLLTNQPLIKHVLNRAYRYTAIYDYSLDKFDEFRDEKGFTHKYIAINWNGDAEFTSIEAGQVLPKSLRNQLSIVPDRMGISDWQRFCRQAIAKHEKEDGVETWVITAPTQRYFDALWNKVVENRFAGSQYSVDICDLSYMKSLAIGTVIDSQDVDRKRIVLQQRLEEIAMPILNVKVQSMLSTQNWGEILSSAMGRNVENDDPFNRPEDKKNVNQASKADGILILWTKTLEPSVKYDFPRKRITKPYPAFGYTEPKKPLEPHHNKKIDNGQYYYPGTTEDERRSCDKYKNDCKQWKDEDMPQYDKNLKDWKDKKNKWDEEKKSYTVNYQYDVMMTPAVSLTGYLRLIDITGEQKIIWSKEISLRKNGESRLITQIPITVRGEDTDPRIPDEVSRYTNIHSWSECKDKNSSEMVYSLGQDILISGMQEGIMKLVDSALWAKDLKSWNLPYAVK
jgi:hypothetical protein